MSSISLIEYCGCGMYRYIDSDGIEHILREPVKCKDCKFSRPSCIKGRLICTNNSLPGDLKDEDYCSKGERKDDI